MKHLLRAFIILSPCVFSSVASAQCNGVFPNNTICGNISGAPNIPGPVSNSALTGVPGGVNPQIQYNNNGAFGGLTDTQVTARINPFTSSLSGAVPASGGGTGDFLRADGTFAAPGISLGGRVTPTSGIPVIVNNAPGVTTLYYAPIPGASPTIPIYNGSTYVATTFTSSPTDSVGLSLQLDPVTTDPGYHASGSAFDLFVGLNSGIPTLVTGPAWSSPTGILNGACGSSASGARGTGAGTTQLALFSGLCVNAVSMTVRYSGGTFTCAQFQCTYVGSFYVPAATTTLRAAISSAGATTISATDWCGSGAYCFPASAVGVSLPFYIKIDSEILQVTNGNECTPGGDGCTTYAGTWTVTRGQLGTVAATHSNGATITMAPGQTLCNLHPPIGVPSAFGGDNSMCLIYNAYNTATMGLFSRENLPGWTFPNPQVTWRTCNLSLGNRITWFDGLGNRTIEPRNYMSIRGFGDSGIGIDDLTAPTGIIPLNSLTTTGGASPALISDGSGANVSGDQTLQMPPALTTTQQLGLHFAQCLEFIDSTTTSSHTIFLNGQGSQMLIGAYQN